MPYTAEGNFCAGFASVPILDLTEARSLVRRLGVPLNRVRLIKNATQARAFARRIGYPLALKVVSPQILHKTEMGGVRINISSDAELVSAYREMKKNVRRAMPEAHITGFLVEEMVSGIELIIGSSVDPQFGRMIMLGLGGIFVEVFKDVVFRIEPITEKDALEMIDELKGRAMLEGVRGQKPVDKKRLADILLKVSRGLKAHPEIAELDINPLIATSKGFKAVDARVLLNPAT